MKTILLFLPSLLCLMLTGCSTPSPEPNEETQVVNALLETWFSDCTETNYPFVLKEELGVKDILVKYGSEAGTLKGYVETLAKEASNMDAGILEAVLDFYEKNSTKYTIDVLGEIEIEHIIYTEEMDHEIFFSNGINPSKNWNIFYQRFPSYPGIIDLSRPGFSKDGTFTVIYMGNLYGRLHGGGRVHILKKENGKWIPSEYKFEKQWISKILQPAHGLYGENAGWFGLKFMRTESHV